MVEPRHRLQGTEKNGKRNRISNRRWSKTYILRSVWFEVECTYSGNFRYYIDNSSVFDSCNWRMVLLENYEWPSYSSNWRNDLKSQKHNQRPPESCLGWGRKTSLWRIISLAKSNAVKTWRRWNKKIIRIKPYGNWYSRADFK